MIMYGYLFNILNMKKFIKAIVEKGSRFMNKKFPTWKEINFAI